MSELLTAASGAMGIPEPLVQRAAAARASAAGMTVDDVLSAWSGGASFVPAAAKVEDESADISTGPADAMETGTSEVADESATPTPPSPSPSAAGGPPINGGTKLGRAPMPTEVTLGEAARLPEVITVPTAGIRERTNSSIPRWLTTLLLAAPLFALFALGGLATGECGEGTELRTDVVTGAIVNCDGSEFTGSGGPGGGGFEFLAVGERIYAGTEVAGVNCASCHGPQGQGLGTFPGMGGVLTTFSACTDHIEWVTLGAQGFRDSGRDTYGDTNKPVSAMPPFGNRLTEEQLASVVAFERVRFGGATPEEAAIACGFAEEDGGDDDGEDPNGGDEEAGVFGYPHDENS